MTGSFMDRITNFAFPGPKRKSEEGEVVIEDDEPRRSKRPRTDGQEYISLVSSDDEAVVVTSQKKQLPLRSPAKSAQPENLRIADDSDDDSSIVNVYVRGRVVDADQMPPENSQKNPIAIDEESHDETVGDPSVVSVDSASVNDEPEVLLQGQQQSSQMHSQNGANAPEKELRQEAETTEIDKRQETAAARAHEGHRGGGKDGNEPPKPPMREPELCPEQKELVDIIMSGRNVFYTGSAGCGKSTVLKAFTKRLRGRNKQVDIVAPTGISALGVGGSTTYTYASWNAASFNQSLQDLRGRAHAKFTRKRLKATDVLVIDEISMVSNFHFERLNAVMQEARGGSNEPFGGVQVIVTGDFHQLPPVKPFETCLQCGKTTIENQKEQTYKCREHGVFHDEDKWAFKSNIWRSCHFVYFPLTTIHRQSDQVFIKILQKCRVGDRLTGDETNLLMNHPCKIGNATKLYATRHEARVENQKRFAKLGSPTFSFPCMDVFDPAPDEPRRETFGARAPDGTLVKLKDHRFEKLAEFKIGMLVVLLVNLDLRSKLCNGSQGIICGYREYDAAQLPELNGEDAEVRAAYVKQFMERPDVKKKVWPVVKFHNGEVRMIVGECSIHTVGDQKPYSRLSRTQIPLAPAWAMSIHKSQSLTLDRVIVDLTRAWEEGQVYVALSRATSLEGLKIEGDPKGLAVGRGGNDDVRRFHRDKFGVRV